MMTKSRASRPFREYHEEQMQKPEFAAAYHAMEPEFQVAREVLRLRLQRGLSQGELAQKAGTKQPNISRLERGTINPSLHFLSRVAAALGTELEIKFRLRETEGSQQEVAQ